MDNDIVTTTLPENIAKEFSVDDNGLGFVSRRGIARLCGVNQTTILKLLKRIKEGDAQSRKNPLSKWLKPYSGQDFEGDAPIPDVLVAMVIKHYAKLGKEQAENVDLALGAIGLRVLIQKLLNYRQVEKRQLTQSEIIELCCLPVPTEWQRRFPQDYYDNLSRLTELKAFGSSRPGIWAKHTKELVYDYLPVGIYDEIKRCKEETGGYDKLHQFLSEDGLTILEQHQRTLLTLMQASSSITDLKRLLNASCTGNYQLLLFDSKPK
jgi:P63C domain